MSIVMQETTLPLSSAFIQLFNKWVRDSSKNNICGALNEMGVKACNWTKKHTSAYGHISLAFLIVYTKWIWAYNCPNLPFFLF